MASFFPVYVDDKYNYPLKQLGKPKVISTFEISLCIVGLELAVMVCTFIHPRTISLMGRKNAILIGFAVQVVTNIILGLLANCSIDQPATFIWSNVLVRFIQGYGDSLTLVTGYSVINQTF